MSTQNSSVSPQSNDWWNQISRALVAPFAVAAAGASDLLRGDLGFRDAKRMWDSATGAPPSGPPATPPPVGSPQPPPAEPPRTTGTTVRVRGLTPTVFVQGGGAPLQYADDPQAVPGYGESGGQTIGLPEVSSFHALASREDLARQEDERRRAIAQVHEKPTEPSESELPYGA